MADKIEIEDTTLISPELHANNLQELNEIRKIKSGETEVPKDKPPRKFSDQLFSFARLYVIGLFSIIVGAGILCKMDAEIAESQFIAIIITMAFDRLTQVGGKFFNPKKKEDED